MVNVSIDEYFKWQEDFYFDYCTYLFPEDKNWCIMTSEGLKNIEKIFKLNCAMIERIDNLEKRLEKYENKDIKPVTEIVKK